LFVTGSCSFILFAELDPVFIWQERLCMEQASIQSISLKAEKAYRDGAFQEAAQLYEQAAGKSEESGDALKAAELRNNSSVAYLQAGDANAALAVIEGSAEVFEQAGDVRRQALSIGNSAAALEGLNRNDEALAQFVRCSELLKSIGDTENRAVVLKSISTLQIRTGRQFEALASMNAAMDNQKQLSFRERVLKKLIKIPFDMINRN
jgi:tetratricopeptide (TPR) repeat protein